MGVAAIVGMQWGDEGKGKIVDLLSEEADIVVRCQGGANAGHTVVIGKEVFKLNLIPSGILHPSATAAIGNGVVVDPQRLVEEIEGLAKRGLNPKGRLWVSDRAHLALPTHKALDGINENRLGTKKIGTTGRGIGPAYTDKAARTGLRVHDMICEKAFAIKLRAHIELVNERIRRLDGQLLDVAAVEAQIIAAANVLRPYIADVADMLHLEFAAGKRILLEGAQGTHLDIDFGTYPFVTSSNTTAGGLSTGSGLPPTAINEVHGVMKAFTTRVGEGPFMTELDGDLALRLRGTGENQWDEYGTTTGRPRRCGWLDLVVAGFAARLSGVTTMHLTKLDVLSGFDELKVCTAYRCNGKESRAMPADIDVLAKCEPVYETLPGWQGDLCEIKKYADLPVNARKYVERIWELLGIKRGTVSVGPRRDQTIAK